MPNKAEDINPQYKFFHLILNTVNTDFVELRRTKSAIPNREFITVEMSNTQIAYTH